MCEYELWKIETSGGVEQGWPTPNGWKAEKNNNTSLWWHKGLINIQENHSICIVILEFARKIVNTKIYCCVKIYYTRHIRYYTVL